VTASRQGRRGCLPGFLAFLGRTGAADADEIDRAHGGAASVGPQHTYALRDDFLSPAEASFFRVLRQAVPDHALIFPKVRLADLVYAPQQESRHAAWQRINRKHVDFVLCDAATLRPLAALELDDRSHRRPDRLERDAFVDRVFAAANLPLLHIPARRSYDPRALGELLARALTQPGTGDPAVAHPFAGAADSAIVGSPGPRACERCGGGMQLRLARQGQRVGEQFWGCTNYPQCRHTAPA